MGTTTEIAWTDATWNPAVGCTHAGTPECDHCYAREAHDKRHRAKVAGKKLAPQYLQPFSTIQTFPERLGQPLHWKKPRRIFVCSTADLFHRDVPLDFILRVFTTMERAKQHTFQVLTKQPARLLEFCRTYGIGDENDWPKNVWAGVTAGTQASANERVPVLLQVPAAVRFVSCEPLLGAVELKPFISTDPAVRKCWRCGYFTNRDEQACPNGCGRLEGDRRLDWVICGGESGPRARQFDVAWARSLRDQCRDAEVPFFMKQLGRNAVVASTLWLEWRKVGSTPITRSEHVAHICTETLDGRNPAEWPQDLRVREMPEVRHG